MAWAIGEGEEIGRLHVDEGRQGLAALGAAWHAWCRRGGRRLLGPWRLLGLITGGRALVPRRPYAQRESFDGRDMTATLASMGRSGVDPEIRIAPRRCPPPLAHSTNKGQSTDRNTTVLAQAGGRLTVPTEEVL